MNSEKIFIKKNPAFYLALDAEYMFSLAEKAVKKKDEEAEGIYSRCVILIYPIALEALINMIYVYYEAYNEGELKGIDLKKKWLEAPKICLPLSGIREVEGTVVYKPGDPISSIDENSKLFKSYWELREIRNNIVHLKPCFKFLDSCNVDTFINKPELYPLTKIPKDISHISFKHAQIAKMIFTQMYDELDRIFMGDIKWIMGSPLLSEQYTDNLDSDY